MGTAKRQVTAPANIRGCGAIVGKPYDVGSGLMVAKLSEKPINPQRHRLAFGLAPKVVGKSYICVLGVGLNAFGAFRKNSSGFPDETPFSFVIQVEGGVQ